MLNNKNTEKISLCLLKNYSSLTEALEQVLGASKNKLKKYGLSAKILNRPVVKNCEIKLPLDLFLQNAINPQYDGRIPPKVLMSDDDFLVLSKPYQVHCHPLSYDEKDNMLSFLRDNNYFEELRVNEKNYDRGLLYRIDYETSGLLLYIRDKTQHPHFRENFKNIVLEKKYLAVVDGRVEETKNLNHYIKYTGHKSHKGVICSAQDLGSFLAQSFIKPLSYNEKKNCTLVELHLNEGIRHQLRIQMLALGHPIIGDPLYSERVEQRMFLHCWKYQLKLQEDLRLYHDPNFELLDDFFSFDC